MRAFCIQHSLLMSTVIQVIWIFHTSTSIRLVKSAANCFADKKISSICTAKISIHCYNGFAFWLMKWYIVRSLAHLPCGSGSAY